MTAACRLDFELSVLPHQESTLSAESLVTLLQALQFPDSDLSRLPLRGCHFAGRQTSRSRVAKVSLS